MNECAARWAVVVGPSRVGEVDLEDRDVCAGDEANDLCAYTEQYRFALMRRPFLDAVPPTDAVGDFNVWGVGVSVGARYRCVVDVGVELFPLGALSSFEVRLGEWGSRECLLQGRVEL